MLNRPVTTISARKRGTTRFLIGSTPSTCSASSSSRILRAPRSAVMAVPPTPARTMAVTFRSEARHDQVLDRVDAQHLQRVQLLADLAGAQVGGDGRAADAGQDDGGDVPI